MARTTLDLRRERVDDVVEEAARVVFAGGAIVYPDETGYVLACDPQRSEAVAHVYESAGSNPHLRVALCVANTIEFLEFAHDNPLAILAAKRLLPAPVVMIVRRPPFFAEAHTAGRLTIGIRVPQDPLAHSILERCGPLVACGIDRSALPHADLVLQRGEVDAAVEPSVVDLTGARARLLREGAVPFDRLSARFGPIDPQR